MAALKQPLEVVSALDSDVEPTERTVHTEEIEATRAVQIGDWTDLDYAAHVTRRLARRVTSESFAADVELWQSVLPHLGSMTEKSVKVELSNMDFYVPDDEFEERKLQAIYARLCDYKFRINAMQAEAARFHSHFDMGHKELTNIATGLCTGGNIPQQKAFGADKTFFISTGKTHWKYIYDYITGHIHALNTAIDQVSSRIKGVQWSQNGYNRGNYESGNAERFEEMNRETQRGSDRNDNDADALTANSEEDDSDDETEARTHRATRRPSHTSSGRSESKPPSLRVSGW